MHTLENVPDLQERLLLPSPSILHGCVDGYRDRSWLRNFSLTLKCLRHCIVHMFPFTHMQDLKRASIKPKHTKNNICLEFKKKMSFANNAWSWEEKTVTNVYNEHYHKVRYLIPDHRSKMFPNADKSCWRCNQAPGTYDQIWWSCTKIEYFWKEISEEVCQILKVSLEFSFSCLLLHIYMNMGRRDWWHSVE